MVLAGGFGTRLKSVVPDTPKALASINGIPFLKLQLDNWTNQGLSSFIFLLHYGANQIIDFLEEEKKIRGNNISFKYVTEDEPLDTGGAILNAINTLDIKSDFLVINADTWLDQGVDVIYDTISPSILVVSLENCSRYGAVKFDKNYKVKSFEEKSLNKKGKGFINAGLMKLSPDIFINSNKRRFSLEKDIFSSLVEKNLLVATPSNAFFIDIGVPKDYEYFCKINK
jgi:D-glycero-alpha-D-manno-heptose 1-phosphate guanylyltransferase